MRGALRQVYDEGKWTDESTNRRNEKIQPYPQACLYFQADFLNFSSCISSLATLAFSHMMKICRGRERENASQATRYALHELHEEEGVSGRVRKKSFWLITNHHGLLVVFTEINRLAPNRRSTHAHLSMQIERMAEIWCRKEMIHPLKHHLALEKSNARWTTKM